MPCTRIPLLGRSGGPRGRNVRSLVRRQRAMPPGGVSPGSRVGKSGETEGTTYGGSLPNMSEVVRLHVGGPVAHGQTTSDPELGGGSRRFVGVGACRPRVPRLWPEVFGRGGTRAPQRPASPGPAAIVTWEPIPPAVPSQPCAGPSEGCPRPRRGRNERGLPRSVRCPLSPAPRESARAVRPSIESQQETPRVLASIGNVFGTVFAGGP